MKFSILSGRNLPNRNASWQIVYEWENIVSETIGLRLEKETAFHSKFFAVLKKFNLQSLANFDFNNSKKLYFLSITNTDWSPYYNHNTIPVVIDFWLKDEQIPSFYKVIKKVPLLLVTSREVYNKLKPNCPVPIEHWPLSFPDYYKIQPSMTFDKKYDFSFIGRPNPFFVRLLDKYCETHPSFSYIMNFGEKGDRYYATNRGEFVAKDEGRQSYLDMISKTKISCYTTPGVDEAKKGANGYNQVTPRVFEMLCNGCHVIGHYPMSDDVVWYDLPTIVPCINTYEEFEKALNAALSNSIDINKVCEFMDKHYTSKRALQIKEIFNNHFTK